LNSKKAINRPVILVVEDEPLLRLNAVGMVESAGFEAVEAADAAQAVAILEKRTDIRVIFTDIDLRKGVDGIRLAAIVRDRWPPIEIILTSGYISPKQADLPERSLFFSKPYKEKEVLEAMRKLAA
jgi:CheY-like chemotaxis protein